MRVLLINTCGAAGVVALADEAGVRAEQALPGRGAGEELLPALRRLFTAVGWAPGTLTAVAVVVGPGSFTGVRVGLSTAKGMAEAAGCGFVGISRLALLVEGSGVGAVALLDAGRGEVFCGWWEGAWMEGLLSAEAARELLARRPGVGCEAAVEVLLGAEVKLVAEPGAREILVEALRRIAAEQWSDVVTADAHYLRRTDAELPAGAAVIRAACAADLAAIVTLERAAGTAPHWGEEVYRGMLLDEARCLLVEEDAGVVRGFAVGLVVAGEGEMESVVVEAGARGRGWVSRFVRTWCGGVRGVGRVWSSWRFGREVPG